MPYISTWVTKKVTHPHQFLLAMFLKTNFLFDVFVNRANFSGKHGEKSIIVCLPGE